MPQTGNERLVFSVDASHGPLYTKFSGINSAVLSTENGQNVWKGITGPEDSGQYTNYWLWFDPTSCSSKETLMEGSSYYFTIAQCTPFQCDGGTFSHGVNIVAKMPPQYSPYSAQQQT